MIILLAKKYTATLILNKVF